MIQKITLQLWLMLVGMPFAYSQSGTLVPTFGVNGISYIDFDQTGTADDVATIIKFDSKGRTVICGTTGNGTYVGGSTSGFFGASAIVRLNPDNSPDSTLDGDGILILPKFGFRNVLVTPNNKMVLVKLSGNTNEVISVTQLNEDGHRDTTFGNQSGILIKDLIYSASFLDKNGKLLVAGTNWINDTNYYVIIRFNTDGSYDNTFGVGGKMLIPVIWPVNFRLMYAEDKLLFAGTVMEDNSKEDFFVMRLNPDGKMDSTFNHGGKLIIPDGNYDDESTTLSIDIAGRILIGGGSSETNISTKFFSMVRLNGNGSIDSTFHCKGKLIIPEISGYISSIQFDHQGKILAGNQSNTDDYPVNIVKIDNDGHIDTSFGENGKISIFRMHNFILDTNDRILLAGNTQLASFKEPLFKHERDFKIIRLDTNGAYDLSFADSGELVLPIGNGGDQARSMAFDNSGKIVLAGYSVVEGYNPESSIARLNPDGSIDSTFSGTGKKILKGSEFDDYVSDLTTDSQGRILTACNVFNSEKGDLYGYVKRLNYDGSLDSSFKAGEELNFQYYHFTKILTSKFSDKILLAYRYWGDSVYYGIRRLNYDGSIDSTFNNGRKLIQINFYWLGEFTIDIDANNKILAAGSIVLNDSVYFEIIRFNPDGSIDSTFNGNGKQYISDGNERDHLLDIAIDKNGKILLVGSSGSIDHSYNLSLARLNPDGGLDSTFGKNGIFVKPGIGSGYSPGPSIYSDNKIFLAYSGFNIEKLNLDGSNDTTFGQQGKINISNGYCYSLMADSNYIWVAGSDEGDYKIVKLYARNFQHIDFDLPDTVQYGDSPIKLAGISSSGLPVSYISSNPSISFIAHDTLHINGPGSVTITAMQVGDGSFYAADPVSRNLTVKSNITVISTQKLEKEIKAYPNPVSGILYLESTGKIKSVVLTGLEGNVIYKNIMVNDTYLAMDLSEFQPGCYLITVQLDDNSPSYIRKIIKL